MNFSSFGIKMPRFLMPNANVDLQKWSVVACDQYTSEPDYWDRVNSCVGDAPSALRMILPEVYLGQVDQDKCTAEINATMREYLDSGVLSNEYEGFVLIDRLLNDGTHRLGLLVSVDLDAYEYTFGAKSLIRATEATVIDRLPPRVRIRKDAPLELPHIMVLYDDPELSLTETLIKKTDEFTQIYDTDLMENGGHITGYLIDSDAHCELIAKSLSNQLERDPDHSFLFAVGDGNHSLAAAKQYWDLVKADLSESEKENHPARYALAEIVNIHDAGLSFDAIHRVLFNVDADEVLKYIEAGCGTGPKQQAITYITDAGEGTLTLYMKEDDDVGAASTALLQAALDKYVADHSSADIDYVHGADVVKRLSAKSGNMGFLLPVMDKSTFFNAIRNQGALTRKTFSMGHAHDKRYYMECKKIK